MKILLVEDERGLSEAVAEVLGKNNFSVDCADNGESGLDCALSGVYDVIVLDIMLPKMDGLSVLKEIRRTGIAAPVLLLTALSSIKDRVTGLDFGADDYLPKPFHMDELMARLRALWRRKSELIVDGIIKFGDLSLNPAALLLSYGDKSVSLTLKEAQLLELLLAYNGSYVSKDAIIEKLWGYDSEVLDANVESQASLLRKKLAAAGAELGVKAARGMGYRIEVSKNV